MILCLGITYTQKSNGLTAFITCLKTADRLLCNPVSQSINYLIFCFFSMSGLIFYLSMQIVNQRKKNNPLVNGQIWAQCEFMNGRYSHCPILLGFPRFASSRRSKTQVTEWQIYVLAFRYLDYRYLDFYITSSHGYFLGHICVNPRRPTHILPQVLSLWEGW